MAQNRPNPIQWRCRGIYHEIQKGDTLYNLGKRYHVSVSSIMYANPLINIYNLQIGSRICIPTGQQQPRGGQEEMQDEYDYGSDV